jgi:hypothetical protein
MCSACIETAALLVGCAMSAGGVTAVAMDKLRVNNGARGVEMMNVAEKDEEMRLINRTKMLAEEYWSIDSADRG